MLIGRERENKENEKISSEDGGISENRNFRSDNRGSRRGINGPRYNGRSRGTRMFQNSERGSSGPSGANNGGFNQPIDTWFNPTKEPKKGRYLQINYHLKIYLLINNNTY